MWSVCIKPKPREAIAESIAISYEDIQWLDGVPDDDIIPTTLITERIFTTAEIRESNNYEARVVLKDYLDNEPVAQFRARGMSLTSLCNRFGQMPEALMVQQAAKLVGHRLGKSNLNKNYHVARENCLDQVREHFGARFETEDDLINEIESIAKLKRSVK